MSGKTTVDDLHEKTEIKSSNSQTDLSESSPFPAARLSYRRPEVNRRVIIWSALGVLAAMILVVSGWATAFAPADERVQEDEPHFVISLSPTPSATPSATPTATATTGPGTLTFLQPTATLTPVSGGRLLVLTPETGDTGWVASDDERIVTVYDPQNHFGDSFLYAGTLGGKIYHAAIQFDLGRIPRGTKIYGAGLRLTGLRADQLGEGESGLWRLQLLAAEIDYHWRNVNYQQIHNAATWATFEPPLTPEDLGEDRINVFEFTPEQLALLERRIFEGSDQFGRKVSFRLDGPMAGGDNLFAWDSGYGPASQGTGPELFLSLGPPPVETPPPYYVVVTSTPSPESVMTAAAISLQMTAEATRLGTATPFPPNWVTPYVVTATPTPGNEATAQVMSQRATAIALTTGEPPNIVTATPTPTYVVITSTPTPEDVLTAAAEALQITAEAVRLGTATPFPPNWVTPAVVTSIPTPANSATSEYVQALMLTTGTPTPTPANVQTATPTSVFVPVGPLVSPTPTVTPSPTPLPIPAVLLGKIIFLSDREGATEEERLRAGLLQATPQVTPQPYVFDPETGQLGRLTAIWPYEVAAARDAWSAEAIYEAYTQQLLWREGTALAIHYYDYLYDVEHVVTTMGAGIVYDPVWSPVSDEIAFVATESGNDEIWAVNRDGSGARQLTRNEWEWDKHPSWSPDGQQIVFYSNRTGHNQIWIMNRDGSEQRLLMDSNPYNDWDPVWIKYPDSPPPLEREPSWQFAKPPEE